MSDSAFCRSALTAPFSLLPSSHRAVCRCSCCATSEAPGRWWGRALAVGAKQQLNDSPGALPVARLPVPGCDPTISEATANPPLGFNWARSGRALPASIELKSGPKVGMLLIRLGSLEGTPSVLRPSTQSRPGPDPKLAGAVLLCTLGVLAGRKQEMPLLPPGRRAL